MKTWERLHAIVAKLLLGRKTLREQRRRELLKTLETGRPGSKTPVAKPGANPNEREQ